MSGLMKTIKRKAFCFLSALDDQKELPTFYATKKDCIESNTSYFGHICDDPEQRGVICAVEISIRVPDSLPKTEAMRHYVRFCGGQPAMQVMGDEKFNSRIRKSAKREQSQQLKRMAQGK